MTFKAWMIAVDQAVQAIAYVSVHDLADCPFRDWFDSGISARSAAEAALENDGFDIETWRRLGG